MEIVSKIVPCRWFDHQGEEAARFYCEQLLEGILDTDRNKAERTFAAMLQMKKPDIEPLRRAHDGA